MAIIPQTNLFSWEDVDDLGDLDRLRLVLDYLPDEDLVGTWEKHRGKGRDDYPIRAVWNAILAGVVFQHKSTAELIRELQRNGELCWLCGFEGKRQVPQPWVFTRMMRKILDAEDQINAMLDQLVRQLQEALPEFGKNLAIDSKAIPSFAQNKNQSETPDGRRDLDADHSQKVYRGRKKDGSMWEKVVKWFGYKLHLVVDADYELPVAYKVTKASHSDMTEGHHMLAQMEERQPELLNIAETLEADRGYDDVKLIQKTWDNYTIKPVIDIRNMWKDPDETRLLEGYDNVTYDNKGTIYCYCPETGKRREMTVGGFEADRMALKKGCPAEAYNLTCAGKAQCPVAQGLRISMERDRRRFTPIDRSSYKWQRLYNKRSSVERVNSRIDGGLGFEKHTIRGKQKMTTRCGIALCVMLAMALGHIKEGQEDKIRSLVS